MMYKKDNEMGWEIDNTHNTFKNGILYMLNEQFRDCEYILEDLISPDLDIFTYIPDTSQRQSYTFKNIETICDKKKQEEVAKMIDEEDKAFEEYLASGKTVLLCSKGRL